MAFRLQCKIPLILVTLALLAMAMVIIPRLSLSDVQTVDELVEYPPLVNIIVDDHWRYESEFLLNSAYSAIKTGDYPSADAFAKKLLELRPDDPAVIQMLVHTSMYLENWADAEENLKELTKIQPDNLTALSRLAFVHGQQKLYGLAAGDYEQILARNPSPELTQYLNKALAEAKNNYEAAAQQSSDAAKRLIADDQAVDGPEFWRQQFEIMSAFLSENPEETKALLARAEAGLNLSRYQAARKDFIAVLNNPLAAEGGHSQAAEGLFRAEKLLLGNPSLAAEETPGVSPAELVRLENRLSQMIDNEPENWTLLFLRGNARLRLGGDYGSPGRADLANVLNAQGLSEEEIKLTENLITNNEARAQRPGAEDGIQAPQFPPAEPDWSKIHETEAVLEGQPNKLSLEKYYTELSEIYPDFPYAYSARGYMRLGDGRLAEARADFIQAIRLENDPKLIASYEETINQIETRIKNARTEMAATTSKSVVTIGGGAREAWRPASDPVENCLELATKAQRTGSDQEFLALIAKIDRQTLNTGQSGRRDYLMAQHLWGQQEYDQAFNLYMKAIEKLPRDFYMSDSYSRVSSYYLMRGDGRTALEYIKKALDITPDFSWHNIQAGNVHLTLKNNEAAINHYLRADSDPSIAMPDRYFYSALARAYLGVGDRDAFDTYMRRHIDSEAERLALKDVTTDEDIRNFHQTKKMFTDMSKKYGGNMYVFGNKYKNSDYIISFSAEVNRKLTILDRRAEVYALAGGILGSSFSGTYFNTWSGQNTRWVGKSKLEDDAYAGLGARFYPISNSNLFIAFEQIFGIGNDKDSDSRLILNLFEAIGNEWEPIRSHWNFASFFGQLTYSLSDNNFLYGSEGRLGHRFNLECFDRLVDITPFVGVLAAYDGESASKGSRWGLEAGPGLIITKWFEEDDAYKVPTSNLDFVIQYRVGLSHDRENLATATLYYSF